MDENLPNKIDEIFNHSLKKFKTDPSAEVWNKIENRLDEDDNKKVGFGWKQYAATIAALIVLLTVIINIYFHNEAIFKKELANQKKAEFSSPASPNASFSNSGRVSKTDLANTGYQKSIIVLHDTMTKNQVNISGNKIEKSVKSDPILQPDRIAGFAETDFEIRPEHKLSVQGVESRLHILQIKTPVLPIQKTENISLTVMHPKKRVADRFSVTPYFSKEFAGYNFKDKDLAGPHGQEIEQRERNVFSASVGFFLNYDISKNWVLQSGMSYSWSNSNIDSCTSYAVKDNQGGIQYKLNTISGYGYLEPGSATQPSVGDSVKTAKSFSQLHYLTIPLVLSYRISRKKFTLLAGAGATFNILTGAEIETNTYGNGSPEKEYCVNMMGLKKINFGMIVKLDLEYSVNTHFGINVIPSFKNTLGPINLESAVAAYPYNFGIGLGMTYRF
jgi:hypothetical protein